MAVIIPNPTNTPEAVSTGYQRQNTVLFSSMVGFCNINMSVAGIISAGSIVEVNGTLVKSYSDEKVSEMNLIPSNSMFFIYAVPISKDTIEYIASTDVPEWSTDKSGYYYDGARAVIRVYKDLSGNIGGITKMSDILSSNIPPNEGGVLIYSKNVRSFEHLYLTPGWYRYEMSSGAGGGSGGTPVNEVGGGGGVPHIYIFKSSVFFCPGASLAVKVGGNGYIGLSGTNGTASGDTWGGGGGGAGGGAGEESYISFLSIKMSTGNVESGSGGRGGTSKRELAIGGLGAFHGGTGRPGQGYNEFSGTGAGGKGFGPDIVAFGYEGWGGSGGGGGTEGPVSGGNGGSVGRSYSSGPGWIRPLGANEAGYVRIYLLQS